MTRCSRCSMELLAGLMLAGLLGAAPLAAAEVVLDDASSPLKNPLPLPRADLRADACVAKPRRSTTTAAVSCLGLGPNLDAQTRSGVLQRTAGAADAAAAAVDVPAAAGAANADVAGAVNTAAVVEGEFTVSFRASSTLHEFSGAAPSRPFTAESSGESGDLWNAELSLAVTDLSTGNRMRDRNMRKMFSAKDHPLIRASLKGISAHSLRAGDDESALLAFELSIRDVTRRLVAKITGWREHDRRVFFEAGFEVSLEEFDLKAPSLLFVKVDDHVHVRVSVNALRAE